MHINMKLNIMHILADLGFGGVSPIYWSKKGKPDIKYTCSRYACLRPSRPKQRHNLDKTSRKQRKHTRVSQERYLSKLYPWAKSTNDWQETKRKSRSRK